jgi:rfaE bifunctional protein nucleotidyltransferase chain/domain
MAKIYKINALLTILDELRQKQKRIVFTNGCFDLMHAGHVHYLRAARDQGDVLVVGLNSDQSVRAIKGPSRPIVEQKMRAQVLEALECVSYVTLFDAPDPLQLIVALKPDVLVKGADWEEAQIVGAREVRRRGGDVVRIPLEPGISTSEIIRRILEKNAAAECS